MHRTPTSVPSSVACDVLVQYREAHKNVYSGIPSPAYESADAFRRKGERGRPLQSSPNLQATCSETHFSFVSGESRSLL
jgi:hypothetical protein